MTNTLDEPAAGTKEAEELAYAVRCLNSEIGTTDEQLILLCKHGYVDECVAYAPSIRGWVNVKRIDGKLIVTGAEKRSRLLEAGVVCVDLNDGLGQAEVPPLTEDELFEKRLYEAVSYSSMRLLPQWAQDAVRAEFKRMQPS